MVKKVILLVFGVNCVGLLLAGLWPLRFRPQNEVAWRQGEHGLHFSGQGVVHSLPGTSAAGEPGFDRQEFSLVMLLRPARTNLAGIPHVVTFYDPVTRTEPLLMGQWQAHLIGRSTAGIPRPGKRYREVGVRGAMQPGQTRCLAVSCGVREVTTWIDGVQAGRVTLPGFASAQRLARCQLILGCNSTGTENWQGDILALGLFDHTLSGDQIRELAHVWMANETRAGNTGTDAVSLYLFDEGGGNIVHDRTGRHDLIIPRTYAAVHKQILIGPWEDFGFNRSYLSDMGANLAGFVPFGVCLALLLYRPGLGLTRKRTGLIVLAGCLLSLGIELAQVQIPTRDSQLMDVIMNTFGTAIGAFIGRLVAERARRGKRRTGGLA